MFLLGVENVAGENFEENKTLVHSNNNCVNSMRNTLSCIINDQNGQINFYAIARVCLFDVLSPNRALSRARFRAEQIVFKQNVKRLRFPDVPRYRLLAKTKKKKERKRQKRSFNHRHDIAQKNITRPLFRQQLL